MAISAAVYEKMPAEIKALVRVESNPGKDAVVALFPQSKAGTETSPRGSGGIWSGVSNTPVGPQYGDSGSAARFFNSFPADDFPWPLAFYHSKAGKADRRAELVDRAAGEKPHPTVKPIGLMRHLVRHICPPGGTVLDPFGGTGTTAEAARLEGMNCVLMEAEPEYIAFLRRRFDLDARQDDAEINLDGLLGANHPADDLSDLI